MYLATLYEFLHLLASVIWIGGGIFANFVFNPSLSVLEPQFRGKLAGEVGKRFSIFAWISAIILLITGLLNTASVLLFNFSSTYAIVLAIKHAIVLIMIILGVMISFVYGPRVGKLAPKPGEPPSVEFLKTQKRLTISTLTSTIAGILLLLCVAIMKTII